MRSKKGLVALLVMTLTSSVAFSQIKVDGCYKSNQLDLGMFGSKICLKPDSSFYYKWEGDLAFANGLGTYHLSKDTIFLVFDKNIKQSILGMLSSHTVIKKDFKLLYKDGKLYSFNVNTGELVNDEGYYLKQFPCEEWKDYQKELSNISN